MKRLFLLTIAYLCVIMTSMANDLPKWVEKRPVSDKDYIGISSASLSVENYSDVARMSALNEIATQISVKIESNTFLNTVDIDGLAKQQFEQNIEESLVAHLSGYELVDTYQSSTDYFVFYKLNKEVYKKYIDEKKKGAIQEGLDLFAKGKQSENNGDISVALSLYSKGMEVVEPYLSLELDGMYGGRYVNVASELFTAAKSIFSGMAITSNVSQLSVQSLKTVKEPVAVCLSKNGVVLPNVLMNAKFVSGTGAITPSVKTDHTGTAIFYVTNVTAKDDVQTLNITIDKSFIEQLPHTFRSLIPISSLPTHKVTLAVTDPVKTAFFNVGTNDIPECERLVRSIFVNNHFEVIENASADLFIQYSTEFRVGNEIDGQMYRMNECFCSMSIKIYNNKTQGLLGEYAIPDLRVLIPIDRSSDQVNNQCAREMMKQFRVRLPAILKNIKL